MVPYSVDKNFSKLYQNRRRYSILTGFEIPLFQGMTIYLYYKL